LGLLVEPNRGFHDRIRASRKGNLDARAAASTSGELVEFEEFVEVGEFSRVAKQGDRQLELSTTKRYNVETVTLEKLLEDHDAPNEIDYISIDTEGSELDILKGFNFDRYRVGFFTIEHNFRSGALEKMAAMLGRRGYRQILPEVSHFDAWFVHNSINSAYIL
jgi:FkbM family methyltransferase